MGVLGLGTRRQAPVTGGRGLTAAEGQGYQSM
jgi:hypothetical protein